MSDSEKTKTEWTITYKQIGVIILSFSLGLICALLFKNAGTDQASTFTTTELIGFVLSVIVSGASIVLAVAAIALGKSSEQSVITRSDESIRLQNEVFTKTTEALQRIEASTGVTEKRIEDIIAGRVGDISHQIAEMATKGGKQSSKDFKELEENIRKSLLSSLREEDDGLAKRRAYMEKRRQEQLEKEQKEKKEEEAYQTAHKSALLDFGNKNDVSIRKLDHGSPSDEGEELFDGLFEHKGEQFAVSTFRPDCSENMLKVFILNAGSELTKSTVKELFVIAFTDDEHTDSPKILGEAVKNLDSKIRPRIHIVSATYENKADIIDKLELSNKAEEPTPNPPSEQIGS